MYSYQNGSILIVGLQPSFTILHTLTAARSPSAVSNLVWHASSTKQRSDMLATQTVDGDLRVWSVSKPPNNETPKTLRVLKRRDNVEPGLHWCAWSKNGRILQYSDGCVSFSFSTPSNWSRTLSGGDATDILIKGDLVMGCQNETRYLRAYTDSGRSQGRGLLWSTGDAVYVGPK